MQTKAAFLMGLWPAAALAALTTSITLHIPASHQLPDPWRLPPSTHATLTSLRVAASAPLTTGNTLVFRNVSAGSYLVDVHAATHAFMPVRLDVAPDAAAEDGQALRVEAWETYRGNDWANKGEAIPLSADGRLEMRALGPKGYFSERSSFSVLTILKNPMILLGLVSMAIFIGMPKLVENMDPEMREEWEKNQKSNPMNNLLSGGGQQQANPMGNFDMAAFLAGQKKDDNGGSSTPGGSKKR